jgi:uncharacterized protein
MVSLDSIQAVADQIARQFHPEKIILFGSYAYGTPRDDSDVDLLVVMPFEGNALHKAVEIISSLANKFAIDLLVRSEEQLQQRAEMNDYFIQEITGKGQILYDVRNS